MKQVELLIELIRVRESLTYKYASFGRLGDKDPEAVDKLVKEQAGFYRDSWILPALERAIAIVEEGMNPRLIEAIEHSIEKGERCDSRSFRRMASSCGGYPRKKV